MEEQKKKNYRVIFWQLFGIGIIINIVMNFSKNDLLSLAALIGFIIWFVFWCKNFNQAWKTIGKKHGWIVGFVALIPFGGLIGIAIAHHYLKGSDYWKGEYKSFRLQK